MVLLGVFVFWYVLLAGSLVSEGPMLLYIRNKHIFFSLTGLQTTLSSRNISYFQSYLCYLFPAAH